ncbi:hypothetical protein FDP41_003291 [Naegleria fowleri]|uniref:non-specific serine/threonine protein kinase n=1 Tax=Naegleria fowleri TaxID=5763 RepID=A0A6A5BYF4_NAEFO|nr:uncharacterized protein FDP41_003291 [Naegleria fowleri]KAF0977969.1 hypothetical protein FDP41_003291 [Naegleria fowleri]
MHTLHVSFQNLSLSIIINDTETLTLSESTSIQFSVLVSSQEQFFYHFKGEEISQFSCQCDLKIQSPLMDVIFVKIQLSDPSNKNGNQYQFRGVVSNDLNSLVQKQTVTRTIHLEPVQVDKDTIPLYCRIENVQITPIDFGWNKESNQSRLAMFLRQTVDQVQNFTKQKSEKSILGLTMKSISSFTDHVDDAHAMNPTNSGNTISDTSPLRKLFRSTHIKYPNLEIRKSIQRFFKAYLLYQNQQVKAQKLLPSQTCDLNIIELKNHSLYKSEFDNYFFSLRMLNELNNMLEFKKKDLFELWVRAHTFFASSSNNSKPFMFSSSPTCLFRKENPSLKNDSIEDQNYLKSKIIDQYYLRYYSRNDDVQKFIHNIVYLWKCMFNTIVESPRGKTVEELLHAENKEIETFIYYLDRIYENISSVFEKNHLYMRLTKVVNKINFVNENSLELFLQNNSTDYEFLRYPDLNVVTSIRILKFLDMVNRKTLEIISHLIKNDELEPLELKIVNALLNSHSFMKLKEVLEQTNHYESKIVSDPYFDRIFEVSPSLFEPFMLPMKTLMSIIDQTLIVFNYGINSIVTSNFVVKKSSYITDELLELKLFIKKDDEKSGFHFHNIRYSDYLAYIFHKQHNRLYNILVKAVADLSKQFEWTRASAWIDSIMERNYPQFFAATKKRFGFKDSNFTTFIFKIIVKLQESASNKQRQKQIDHLLSIIPSELPWDVKQLPEKRVVKDRSIPPFDVEEEELSTPHRRWKTLNSKVPPAPQLSQIISITTKDTTPKRKLAGIIQVFDADHELLKDYRNRTMDTQVIDKVSLYYLFITSSICLDTSTYLTETFKLCKRFSQSSQNNVLRTTIPKVTNRTVSILQSSYNSTKDNQSTIDSITTTTSTIPPPPPLSPNSGKPFATTTADAKYSPPQPPPKPKKLEFSKEFYEKLAEVKKINTTSTWSLRQLLDLDDDVEISSDGLIEDLLDKVIPLYTLLKFHNIDLNALIQTDNSYNTINQAILNQRYSVVKEVLPSNVVKTICLFLFPTNLLYVSLVSKQFFQEAHKIFFPKSVNNVLCAWERYPALTYLKVTGIVRKKRHQLAQLKDYVSNFLYMITLENLEKKLDMLGFHHAKEDLLTFFSLKKDVLALRLTQLYQDEKQFIFSRFFSWFFRLSDSLNYDIPKLARFKHEREIFKRICASYLFLSLSSSKNDTLPNVGSHPLVLIRNMIKTVSIAYPNVNILMLLADFFDISEANVAQLFQYRREWKMISEIGLKFKEYSIDLENFFTKNANVLNTYYNPNEFIKQAKDILKKAYESLDNSDLVDIECLLTKYCMKCKDYYQYYLLLNGHESKLSLEQAMFMAISLNQFEELEQIIEKGANINAVTKHGFDICTASLPCRNQEITKYCQHIRIEYLLLKQPSKLEDFPFNISLLMHTIRENNIQAVNLMIQLNPEILYEYDGKYRPIDFSIVHHSHVVESTEILLRHMLTQDKEHNVLVLSKTCFIAIDHDRYDALKLLIEKEPYLVLRNELFDFRYPEAYYSNPSLLLYCLRKRKTQCVQLLIEKFPQLLNFKLSSMYTEKTTNLIGAKNNTPKSKTSLGNLILNGTPLTFAVETNQMKMALMLVEMGADLSVTKNGMDLAELSESTENSEMMQWARKILNKSTQYDCYKFEVEYVDNMLNLYRKRFKMVVNPNESVEDFVRKAKIRCGIRGQYELQFYDPDFKELVDVIDLKDMQLDEEELNLIKLKRVRANDAPSAQNHGQVKNMKYEQYLGMIFQEKYKIVKTIDEGGFGVVFEAEVLLGDVNIVVESPSTGPTTTSTHETNRVKNVALKMVNCPKGSVQKQIQDAEHEALLVQQLQHPTIVKIIDTFQIDTQYSSIFCIVMELYIFGDVMQLINTQRQKSEPIPLEIVWKILTQMASAIDYIHSHNIMHRDIKPHNIFVKYYNKEEKNIDIVLGDFGIAKENAHTTRQTYAGSLCYISVEILLNQPYGFATDMYSLGVTLFQLLSLDTSLSICSLLIHSEDNCLQELKKKILTNYQDHLDHNKGLLQKLIRVMSQLLRFQPQSRLNSSQLLLELEKR